MALLGESWSGNASCGHLAELDLSELSVDRRQARVSWIQKSGKCKTCFAVLREKQFEESKADWLADKRAAEIATTERFEQENEMPPLDGSPKQVEFARRVRCQLLSTAYEVLVLNGDMSEADFGAAIEQRSREIGRAGWWLDQRSSEPEDLATLLESGVTDQENLVECENSL